MLLVEFFECIISIYIYIVKKMYNFEGYNLLNKNYTRKEIQPLYTHLRKSIKRTFRRVGGGDRQVGSVQARAAGGTAALH